MQGVLWNTVGLAKYAPLSTFNDIWYFVFTDFVLIAICFLVVTLLKSNWTLFLLWLAIGKLFDEFIHPYMSYEGEIFWDIIGIYIYFIRKIKIHKN